MRILKGAEVHRLSVQALIAWMTANEVFQSFGYESWLKQGSDGIEGSKHSQGQAIAISTASVRPYTKISVLAGQINDRLGSDYRVIIEPDSIYIEYEPK